MSGQLESNLHYSVFLSSVLFGILVSVFLRLSFQISFLLAQPTPTQPMCCLVFSQQHWPQSENTLLVDAQPFLSEVLHPALPSVQLSLKLKKLLQLSGSITCSAGSS